MNHMGVRKTVVSTMPLSGQVVPTFIGPSASKALAEEFRTGLLEFSKTVSDEEYFKHR